MRRVVGVDPGGIGAVVLREDGRVVGAWAVAIVGTRVRVRSSEGVVDVPSLAEAGRVVAAAIGPVDVVVVEEVVPPTKRKGRPPTQKAIGDVIVLAERAGELIGSLRAIGPVERIPAGDWRRRAGVEAGSGQRSEEAAVRLARSEGWLELLRGWTVAEQGACAEAGAIASVGSLASSQTVARVSVAPGVDGRDSGPSATSGGGCLAQVTRARCLWDGRRCARVGCARGRNDATAEL